MDRNRSSMNSIKQDLQHLFDEISEIISDEKGQVSEDEIQQLVGLLRSKVKKLQTTNKKPTITGFDKLTEKRDIGNVQNFISESNVPSKGSTMSVLEVISEKMSNYIIQEKGGIFEKDILEIADQLRNFSSLSIVNKSCNNSNKALSENSKNYNLCVSSRTSKNLKKTNTNCDSEIHSDSKNETENSSFNYENLANEIQNKDFNDEKKQCENSNSTLKKYENQTSVLQNHSRQDVLHSNPAKSETKLLNDADNRSTLSPEDKKTCSSLIEDQQTAGNISIGKPRRRRWESGKSKACFKTTGRMNSVTYSSDKCNSIQDNTNDTSNKISLLFSKVTDVILEKHNIEETDVEDIASKLKHSQTEEKADQLKKDFALFNPDMPHWALRGYLCDVIGPNDFKKPMIYLLNKTAEYIIYEKGQICQSDIIKFCSVLTRKILNHPKKADNRKTLRISQTPQTNMKSKESKARASSPKCHQTQNLRHNLESTKDKKQCLPTEMKTAITEPSNSIILMKSIATNPNIFASDSVRNAIEQGIRSLEFIRNLSAQILLDINVPEPDDENIEPNELLPLKIHQQQVQKSCDSFTCDNNIRKSIKNNNSVKPKQNVMHKRSTECKTTDKQHKVKPISQIMDTGVKEKNTSLSMKTATTKNGQVNNQVPRSKQSNNENNKKEQQMINDKDHKVEKSIQRSSYPLSRCKTDIKKPSKILSFGLSIQSSNHPFVDQTLKSQLVNSTSKQINTSTEANQPMNLKQASEKSQQISTSHLDSSLDKNEEASLDSSHKPQMVLKIIKTFSLCRSFPTNLKKKNEVNVLSPTDKKQGRKNEALLKLDCNNLNKVKEDYFPSKIPIRTLPVHLTRGVSFCGNQ